MSPQCHDEAILNSESAKWECNNPDHEPIYVEG